MRIISKIISKYKSVRINSSQQTKLDWMRKQGAFIGDRTTILSPATCLGSEPYMVSIGSDCLISSNVHFVTHDGGMNVINNLGLFKEEMDKLRPIKVGNNVFIGIGAVILGGVTIGDNCIVGAKSVVTKNVRSNTCVAGIPAKEICTITEYVEKNKQWFYPTYRMNDNEKRDYVCTNIINNQK